MVQRIAIIWIRVMDECILVTEIAGIIKIKTFDHEIFLYFILRYHLSLMFYCC